MKKRLLCLALCLVLLAGVLPAAQAASDMTASDAILQFIADHEGLSTSVMWSGGYAYIGYGCQCNAADYPNGITQAGAMQLLSGTVQNIADFVNSRMDKYGVTLTQSQFDAILSFTYNFGIGWLTTDKDLFNLIFVNGLSCTAGELAQNWGAWCHIGTAVSSNLANRRAWELRIFLYGDYAGNNPSSVTWTSSTAFGSGVAFSVNTADADSAVNGLSAAAVPVVQLPTQPEPTGDESAVPPEEPTAEPTSEPAPEPGGEAATDPAAEAEPALSEAVVQATAAQAVQTGSFSSTLIRFLDVGQSDWFYDYITELAAMGVVNGYEDETFRPGDYISCGEALKLVLAITGRAGNAGSTAAGDHWASGYLQVAIDQGILQQGDVTSLANPITRRFLAKLIVGALGTPREPSPSPFADTDDANAAALYQYGISQGSFNEAGQLVYRPTQLVTRSEMAAFVWRINALGV